MKLTGSQILLKGLEREGVKHIFGFPGGVVLDIYDELTRAPFLKHFLVRHEQGAAHAADGYARASARWVSAGDLGTRGHQYGYGNRLGLYGFHSHGGVYGPGADRH